MKKLATFTMQDGRVITGFIHEPLSDTYYLTQIVKVENTPLGDDDWQDNDMVKISKELVTKIKYHDKDR